MRAPLAHNVITKGKLVYERSDLPESPFKCRSLNLFMDLEPMHKLHIEGLKRRYLKGPANVDSHVILARFDKIRECVAKLQRFATVDESSFLTDISATDNAERIIQIAIQAVIDVGNHIVSDLVLGTPQDYKDIFHLLAGRNIITGLLAAKLISMTGLRNILVHDYMEIDLRLIYRIITSELGDFEEFISAALKLI